MSLSAAEIADWAATLATARRDRTGCAPISSSIELSLDDAYAIQRAGTALRLQRGEKVVGWKLGYTSLAMRAQMGIDQPNFGPLTDAMLVADDGPAGPALMQPRVEPEIGLRFERSLPEGADLREVLDAVSETFACLEIVDSVYPDYRFRLEDNTADGSSAAQVVVGPALKRRALPQRRRERFGDWASGVRSSCSGRCLARRAVGPAGSAHRGRSHRHHRRAHSGGPAGNG